MTNSEKCDPKTLALIAAQFIAAGDNEEEALQKANALYLKATAYAKWFASLPPDEKEIEALSEEEMRALGERKGEDLAIGDSEKNSPALEYFRKTAKTIKDRTIGYKAFLRIIERFYDWRPEEEKTKPVPCPIVPARIAGYEPVPWRLDVIGRGMLDELHDLLRTARSQYKAVQREKLKLVTLTNLNEDERRENRP